MKIHEYQGKEIFRKFGMVTPRGFPCFSVEEAVEAAKKLGGSVWVVKAQIHAGGRGKGGGVKVAKSLEEVRTLASSILGMQLKTHQTGPDGQKVRRLLVEEGADIKKELYIGMVVDRVTQRACLMASSEGGMDIEDVAHSTPEKIHTFTIDPATGVWPTHTRNLAKALGLIQESVTRPAATLGKPTLKTQVIHFINKPLPRGVPTRTSRGMLDIEDDEVIPVIRDPKKTTDESDAVFYFPGCGSERLFSQVGLATQAMLYETGAVTVLPPGYLCCGYPQTAAGEEDKGQKITTDNRVLFHRVANTLNYLDIKTVVVSCGTCYDQLQGYEFDKIFPGCRIIDIHEYLLEKNITLDTGGGGGNGYLYHDPCHSPMKLQDPMKTVKALVGSNVLKNDRCCGESGTLGVTRPDISTQIRFRKEEELRKGETALRTLTGQSPEAQGNVKILTSCPSCLQGLSRYGNDLNNGLLEADYIVVEMANQILGKDWLPEYVQVANAGGIERVLV